MTLVTKISRLRHPGVLRDFSWPAELRSLSRYNLIYGLNGSGKTTISNMFRALELRKWPEGEVELTTPNTTISGGDFPQAKLPVRVFNRDFVSASVFPVGGGQLPPIFVLGEASAEKQAQVAQLKVERAEAQIALEAAKKEKDRAASDIDKHCVYRAKEIKDTLRSAGDNPYNNYDKGRYKGRADRMLSAGDKASHLLTDDELERFRARSQAKPKDPVSEVELRLPDLQQFTEKVRQLLRKSVVSSVIATLKNDSQLSPWTLDGLRLHQQREADRCLFCEQPLPDGRIAALEAHFSTEYEQLVRQLDAQIADLEAASRLVSQASPPNRAQLYEDMADDFDQAKRGLDEAFTTVGGYLAMLIKAINNKKQKVFETRTLDATVPNVDESVVTNIDAIIKLHNQACHDFASHVSTARAKLEANSVASALDDYQSLVDALEAQETAIGEAITECQKLDGQIARLEREIIEHRQPAEELNRQLYSYLGHAELELDVKKTGYTIMRNGAPARSLSEGEMTAIALLYFLKSLKDRSFKLGNGLIVLDDPVSSLDANALFTAFGFIKSCVDDAAQVIILTHNFAMFRQVRNWLTSREKKRQSEFYMMDCSLAHQGRRSRIAPLDRLLEDYGSEYHYLFACVYRRAKEDIQGGLERNYIFPNMARRMLEAFLAFRHPEIKGGLAKQLEKVKDGFDESKKTRILRFLHTHSHAASMVDPEHDPSALGEGQDVLCNVLALIQHEDEAHYHAMEKLVLRN